MATMLSGTAVEHTSATGEFKRLAAVFRNTISDAEGAEFRPEAGRYILYISLACPWACRCLAMLYMKGLEDVIELSVTHPTWAKTKPDDANDGHCGWQFKSASDPPVANAQGKGCFGCEGCVPDPLGASFVRDIYERCGAPPGATFSVPILYDRKTQKIVNNESSEIIRLFNTAFNAVAKFPKVDMYPAPLREAIDSVNEWVYHKVNNGVYRCGFAKTQAAYEDAFADVSDALSRLETILSTQRYVAGDFFTEADIRLFATLIRFDCVYVVYFKTDTRLIRERTNLLNYVREIYQIPAMRRSVNFDHIKTHYFTSHPILNAHAIIPVGIGAAIWDEPHDRKRFADTA